MSNLHPNLEDDQLHVAKGFASASNGQKLWRNEKGNQSFDNCVIYPQALSLVSSYSTPPSENYNDIYLLDGTSNHADWDGISVDSWARYDGTTWYGIPPNEGDRCYVLDDHEDLIYDGTTWIPYTNGGSKIYVANIDQTGVNDPTAYVLENTLGGDIVWTRTTDGRYLGTLANAFPAQDKTVIFIRSIFADPQPYIMTAKWNDSSSIEIGTFAATTLTDGIMESISIEIRVYP